MGSVYRRGKIYWIAYYKNGRLYRESTESESEREAKRLLKLREGEVVSGKFPGLRPQRVRFDELAQDLINDYKVNGRRSLGRVELSLKHLGEFFGGMRGIEITTDSVKAYIAQRKEEGAANATINRELSALKRMFSLGTKETPPKVLSLPHIPRLRENNVRQGYFEHDEFLAVRGNLPEHLKPVVTLAYFTGMRKGEILSLKWEQVDLERGIVKLGPKTTKNDEPRVIPVCEEVRRAMAEHWERHMANDPLCPWVFTKRKRRILDFEKAWATACRRAEVNRLFHDLRRTAVRNMVRAGIPEAVAMKISGHKTRSIFDRYNIVNEEDLVKAAERLSDYLYTNIHNLFTIDHIEQGDNSLND